MKVNDLTFSISESKLFQTTCEPVSTLLFGEDMGVKWSRDVDTPPQSCACKMYPIFTVFKILIFKENLIKSWAKQIPNSKGR
jgi:hypothetical protein